MKKLIGLAALTLVAQAASATEKTITLPVTENHQRVIVALWEGDIKVQAGASDALELFLECTAPEIPPMTEEAGLRSLRASAVLPDISSSEEVIAIRTYDYGPQCSVNLNVPEGLQLHTRINKSGSVSVDAWRGALVAWSADGDVTVTGYRGSLSVTAMNGDALVTLAETGIDADSAITAANGQLTLIVQPGNVPALRAQARWGDVQTNLDMPFDEIIEDGNSWFVSKAASGTPVLTLRNLNRSIVIRSNSS